MICSVNTEKAVPEIVAVLHKYQIPIALVSQVFDRVMHDINANTVPYNPNLIFPFPDIKEPSEVPIVFVTLLRVSFLS